MIKIKEASGAKCDPEIAQALGVTYQRYRTWKSRNHIPYAEIINFCIETGSNIENIFDIKSEEACLPADTVLLSHQIIPNESEWLSQVASPENMLLVRVVTNNMAPWVSDGDIVIVDTALTNIVHGVPYILAYGDTLIPKRLYTRAGGEILAKSDCNICDDEIFPPDSHYPVIIGKIVRRLVR